MPANSRRDLIRRLRVNMNCPYFSFEIIAHCILFPQDQTEWQMYLRQCIEIVAKIAELAPLETYNLVVS